MMPYVNMTFRWFAIYRGINIYEVMANREVTGAFALPLGFSVLQSDSLDDLRREVDDWWRLRRN